MVMIVLSCEYYHNSSSSTRREENPGDPGYEVGENRSTNSKTNILLVMKHNPFGDTYYGDVTK